MERKLFCYTGCLQEMFRIHGIDIPEEILMCSDDFLKIFCGTDYDSVHTSLVDIKNDTVDKVGDQLGFKINVLPTISVDILQQYLKEFHSILLYIDCKKLIYSKLFSNALTQTSHYVYVTDINDNGIYVYDHLIPTIPRTVYVGWIELNKDFLNKTNAYYLTVDNFQGTLSTEAITANIAKSVRSAINNDNNYKMFTKFYNNVQNFKLLNVNDIKNIVLEMSMDVEYGTAKPTRYALQKLLYECRIINDTSKLHIMLNDNCENYHILSRLFLKCYFRVNEYDMEQAKCYILKIRDNEQLMFEEINKILRCY